jgi:hypothetical protein
MPRPGLDFACLPWKELLRHLEEWDYRGECHDFVEIALDNAILEHLEEWDRNDLSDAGEDRIGADAWSDLPSTPAPPPSDRAHPLWDKELDG